MGTANQIITDALKLIGVYQKGEAIDGDEAADGLRALNLMIDSWANESLMLFQFVQRSLALTAGDPSYTIGSGGDIAVTRPVKIHHAFVRDSSNNDSDLYIINNADYSSIPLKTNGNAYPTALYYRPNFPLGAITLYPEPSASLTLYLECWDQLTQFASLTTSASFPPGYERALIYNLPIEIASMYGKSVLPEVIKIANDAKSRIKDVNDKDIPILRSELLVGRGVSKSNYFPFR